MRPPLRMARPEEKEQKSKSPDARLKREQKPRICGDVKEGGGESSIPGRKRKSLASSSG